MTPSASIGVAWSHDPIIDADAFVARADRAMYRSKREGLGQAVLDDEVSFLPSPLPG